MSRVHPAKITRFICHGIPNHATNDQNNQHAQAAANVASMFHVLCLSRHRSEYISLTSLSLSLSLSVDQIRISALLIILFKGPPTPARIRPAYTSYTFEVSIEMSRIKMTNRKNH